MNKIRSQIPIKRLMKWSISIGIVAGFVLVLLTAFAVRTLDDDGEVTIHFLGLSMMTGAKEGNVRTLVPHVWLPFVLLGTPLLILTVLAWTYSRLHRRD